MHHEALTEHSKLLFPGLRQFPEFYLAGGTALALQIGHRVSVDFDLFSESPIRKNLLSKVKRVYADAPVHTSVNNPDELTVFIEETKITFLHYPFPTLAVPDAHEGIRILGVLEIAATKAYTIGRRGSYKDYIDLYFILAEHHASLEDIIELAQKKYGGEFNDRLFLEQLVYLDDIEDTAITLLRGGEITVPMLEKFFSEEVGRMAF